MFEGGGIIHGVLKKFTKSYHDIISVENLLCAWKEFIRGKRQKKDVQQFAYNLMDNILQLHDDLKRETYVHGSYHQFNISDPKPRSIHKATVRDRLLHHAIYRILYPYFDTKFTHDSYSCRKYKGTHRAIRRFQHFYNKASCNNTKTVWALKCDIRKFFASIDHTILFVILNKYIQDARVINLLKRVVCSFKSQTTGVGLPLGNLTSQLLVNIYMNEFDQHIKHVMCVQYYIRYADDFVCILPTNYECQHVLQKITVFLQNHLRLQLHPHKVFVKTFTSGVDFLGWVHFYDHHVLRPATAKRIGKKLSVADVSQQARVSYVGLLKHGNTFKLKQRFGL